MRILPIVLSVFIFSSCGVLRKNVQYNKNKEDVRIDSETIDTTKKETTSNVSVSDTAITITSENGEYTIEFEPKTIGDTTMIIPVKITGKYTKQTQKKEGKQQTSSITQAEQKGESDRVIIDQKKDVESKDKKVTRFSVPIIPIIAIAVVLFLLLKIFPPNFIKDKILTLIRRIC